MVLNRDLSDFIKVWYISRQHVRMAESTGVNDVVNNIFIVLWIWNVLNSGQTSHYVVHFLSDCEKHRTVEKGQEPIETAVPPSIGLLWNGGCICIRNIVLRFSVRFYCSPLTTNLSIPRKNNMVQYMVSYPVLFYFILVNPKKNENWSDSWSVVHPHDINNKLRQWQEHQPHN